VKLTADDFADPAATAARILRGFKLIP